MNRLANVREEGDDILGCRMRDGDNFISTFKVHLYTGSKLRDRYHARLPMGNPQRNGIEKPRKDTQPRRTIMAGKRIAVRAMEPPEIEQNVNPIK